MSVKKCTVCKNVKPFADFNKQKTGKYQLQPKCRDCSKMYSSASKDKANARKKSFYNSIKGRAFHLIKNARNRRPENFDVSELYVETLLHGRCAKSGIKFEFSSSDLTFRNPFSPSIDRKDNTKGYTNANIQLVLNMYNHGKGEAKEIDFIAMCMAVAEMNKNNYEAVIRMKELTGV